MNNKIIKKQKEQEVKQLQDAHVNQWRPVRKLQMAHKINGRDVLMVNFKPTKEYAYGEVVDFVKKMQNQLKQEGNVNTIQVGFELSSKAHLNAKHVSSKMTDIDVDIEIQDPKNLYEGSYKISGFTIYLS